MKYTDETGKTKEKSKSGFKTKKEAHLSASRFEENLNLGLNPSDENKLFKIYIMEWLEIYKKPFVRKITYSVIERVVRLNLIPKFGNYRLKDINRNEYQKWINTLVKKYSTGTIRRIHSIMNTSINDAVLDFKVLPHNPLQKIKIPIDENMEENKLKYFSVNDIKKLLISLKTHTHQKYRNSKQYYSLFYLIYTTGIRIGEALALTWDDVDFKNNFIHINKTIVYPINSKPYISKPKSKCSNRTLLLDDKTVSVLKSHRINQKEVYLQYANYKQTKKNIIFHQHTGDYLRINTTREFFKKACEKAGIEQLSPHALRHSHAVHLVESGANIKYVSERLGHASIKITADTYVHVTKKIENESLNMYQNYIDL